MRRPGKPSVRARALAGLAALAVLAFAGGLLVGARTPAAIPADPGSDEVRIVTYNIRAGWGGLDALAADLEALSPDLVALQEVERGIPRSRSLDQVGRLGEALGLETAFAGSFPVEEGEHGIAMLSRWPLSDLEVLPLPQGRGKWPRVALLARVETPRGSMRFVCVHLARPWGWPLSNTGTRLEQIRALRERLAREELPVIVAGDFNSVPWSPEGWLATRDLSNSWDPWRDGWGTTFPLRAIGLAGSVKIDHVLHGQEWTARGTWVGPPGASDHRPVVADLAWSR